MFCLRTQVCGHLFHNHWKLIYHQWMFWVEIAIFLHFHFMGHWPKLSYHSASSQGAVIAEGHIPQSGWLPVIFYLGFLHWNRCLLSIWNRDIRDIWPWSFLWPCFLPLAMDEPSYHRERANGTDKQRKAQITTLNDGVSVVALIIVGLWISLDIKLPRFDYLPL